MLLILKLSQIFCQKRLTNVYQYNQLEIQNSNYMKAVPAQTHSIMAWIMHTPFKQPLYTVQANKARILNWAFLCNPKNEVKA